MHEKVQAVLREISCRQTKLLVETVIKKNYERFTKEPAACGVHHAYVGGLLVHSCETAILAGKIADHFKYQGKDVDKSICVAGAVLHDIGKVKCYKAKKDSFESTRASKYFHHIPIGFHLVSSVAEQLWPKGPPNSYLIDKILHCIISHHGRKEYSSPRTPRFPEAWIVAKADFLDAYMNSPTDKRGIYGK